MESLMELSTSVNFDALNNALTLIARLIDALGAGQDFLSSNHNTMVY
jgi:hypothetical protein